MTDRAIQLRIYHRKLPEGIHGVSLRNEGTISIIVNGLESEEEQTKAFLHECLHVWHGDHDKEGINVNAPEAIRHREMDKLAEELLL